MMNEKKTNGITNYPLRKVFKERNEHTRELEHKYPWVPISYRWTVCILVAVLIIVLGDMSIQNRIAAAERAKEELRQQQIQAEQQILLEQEEAKRLAEEQAEREQREQDTILMAKLLSGIDGFVENYGYSEGDLATYLECPINRVIDKSHGFPNTLSEVILQENQWVGFSENNQVIDKYYKLASTVVNNYYDGKNRPCSSDYLWAELNREGIWLKNSYDSSYARRWRY
jgi:Sec-independent protein translocase protein TatA